MAQRIAISKLNASTVDILNTIRANASYQYQNLVPQVSKATDIPKVGEVIYGYPAIANEFISTLINRIALVAVKSAIFNNPLSSFKKGYLEFAETIEEAFVSLTRARVYDVEKAPAREFKRTLPDVKTAFHVMNWKVMYPITIQEDELKRAFLSEGGVRDLVTKIINAVYTASYYDEWLLTKYMLIKAISHGRVKAIGFDATDMKKGAVAFRSASNVLPFMSKEYNEAGVMTTTPKEAQHILMSADFNANFDVDVLASAFNMDRATFIGKLHLVDDWTSFDSERFADIMSESDGLEPITSAELALMQDVKAVILDDEWFQIYDNLTKFTEVYVSSGLYWNYNLHIWKTISHSPFSNIIAFCDDGATITNPTSVTAKVTGVETYDGGTIITLAIDDSTGSLQPLNGKFIQTQADVTAGLAVLPQGAFIVPTAVTSLSSSHMVYQIGEDTYAPASAKTVSTTKVNDTITLAKQ